MNNLEGADKLLLNGMANTYVQQNATPQAKLPRNSASRVIIKNGSRKKQQMRI